VVRLLVDVVALLGVVICKSTTSEYIKYSASPNRGEMMWMVEVVVLFKRKGFRPRRALSFPPVPGL
jgi:hypothetical protein